MSFFSVIIPTYNRAHCILQTIASVQNQTFQDWELLVIDDGSTDNTAEVVSNLRDARVHYYYKENGERGAARNFGIQKAKGSYLFFLDSDDLIKPDYLQYAAQLIHETHANCVHIPYNFLTSSGERKGPATTTNPQRDLRKQNRFACQVVVHKDCLREIKFSENRNFKIGEDWFFILLLLSKYKFVVGQQRLGLIVQHSNRSMIEASYQTVLESLAIFQDELAKHLPDDKQVMKNVRHELTNLGALHAAIHGEKRVAWKLLRKSVKIDWARCFRYRNLVMLKKIILGR